VWFIDGGMTKAIGRITLAGVITEFSAGLDAASLPNDLTLGPGGNLWFTEFTAGLTTGVPDDITAGLDGNLWVPQEADSPTSASVDRITPAGVIPNFTAGLDSGGGGDGDTIVTGPDGNLWFNDLGDPKAIARILLQIPPTAVTGAAGAVTSSSATVAGSVNPRGSATTVTFQYGTSPALGSTSAAGSLAASGSPSAVSASLTGLPAGTVVYYRAVGSNVGGTTVGSVQTLTTTQAPSPLPSPSPSPLPSPPSGRSATAKFGNQQITLTTPSLLTCTASSQTLSVTLSSAAIRNAHGAQLRFANVAFYRDRGVRHTRKETKHGRGGKKKKVTVTVFTSNAVKRHVPVTLSLPLKGLRSGTHTLKVTLSYRTSETKRGHKRTVTVTKSLTATFRVC
jgi:hypothetical protein